MVDELKAWLCVVWRSGWCSSRYQEMSVQWRVVTLSCEELVALYRNLINISYSCYAAYLKAGQKLFPSLRKREVTERGCIMPSSQCESLQWYSGYICPYVVVAWHVNTSVKSAQWNKLFVCTLCVKVYEVQVRSFKDNTCHIYQTRVKN